MSVETFNSPGKHSSQAASADGSAWAAILAAGIGCTAFGLFTDLSEASTRVGAMLNWYHPSGSLSGVAGCAVLIWLPAWMLLAAAWRHRRLSSPGLVMLLTIVLVLAGLITTFPPFYSLLGGD